MLKWPMWLRVVLGIAAVGTCLALSFVLEPYLGEWGLFLLLPGAAGFIFLNPELRWEE